MSDAFMFNVIKDKAYQPTKIWILASVDLLLLFYRMPFKMYEEIIFMDSF